MQLTDLPSVKGCDASSCAYNQDAQCHAPAITIGDLHTPECDTFLNHARHVRQTDIMGRVGACKVEQCVHNRDFKCSCSSISVHYSGSEVRCLTYKVAS